MQYFYDYVCVPNSFRIRAEKEKNTSKGVKLNFFINDKIALSLTHTLSIYTPTEDDINAYVARCCTFISETSENYIQDRIDEEYVMGALNFHRFLRKVYTKPGKTIWTTKG